MWEAELKKRILFPVLVIAGLWAWNSSLLATPPENPQAKLLSHRGVHQTFNRENLKNDTCTAQRIYEPTHDYVENTVLSSKEAFRVGANVVEIDIHLTKDNKFAVFHDWTLDCRTNGNGPLRSKTLVELQQLDVGYGYTADEGATYPLRGLYVGVMPELEVFLTRFPDQKFLINFKSNDRAEGEALVQFFNERPNLKTQLFGVYGGARPTDLVVKNLPGTKGYTKPQIKNCLVQYAAVGWSGYVPAECQKSFVIVPANFAWALWGWPNRFQQRMADAGSTVILLGTTSINAIGSTGIDAVEQLGMVPKDFDGYVWTNRIESIGPYFKSVAD
ncbi:glycerophosphodiester phosphodiesterase family protein [Maritalea sp.]|uniref:glycerophosphodiester phosphodiesterase family protein n=1 Tax=Maritalea sp. TaxID=2003361 RepID=UPI003EF40A04